MYKRFFDLWLSFQPRTECVQPVLGEIPWARRVPCHETGKGPSDLLVRSLGAQKPKLGTDKQSRP